MKDARPLQVDSRYHPDTQNSYQIDGKCLWYGACFALENWQACCQFNL